MFFDSAPKWRNFIKSGHAVFGQDLKLQISVDPPSLYSREQPTDFLSLFSSIFIQNRPFYSCYSESVHHLNHEAL